MSAESAAARSKVSFDLQEIGAEQKVAVWAVVKRGISAMGVERRLLVEYVVESNLDCSERVPKTGPGGALVFGLG